MALALVVGVGAGLGAAVLVSALRLVSNSVLRVAEQGPSLGRAWLFLFIPAGIWLAWAIAARGLQRLWDTGYPRFSLR
jgi:hypothetical protein